MGNVKHTKEYAEKLAFEEYNETFNSRDFQIAQKNSQSGFQRGYMKAIEETAAPEMLEALKEMNAWVAVNFPEHGMKHEFGTCASFNQMRTAIRNATK